ncbi:hypothetical protein [Actinoplanes sp. TFC3]|uniref:hypothetical protein n=1 Tax=Actinoplanes sp. TFC3 TaxID=1710355 RepID=UPI00083621C0|nr:hypothetical protein [Actinoplanes sp. TFC3]
MQKPTQHTTPGFPWSTEHTYPDTLPDDTPTVLDFADTARAMTAAELAELAPPDRAEIERFRQTDHTRHAPTEPADPKGHR